MSLTNFFFDLGRVPDDVLSYTDQSFYDFVETFTGKIHARILALLHISSVPCFLLTENPCAILTMDIEDEMLRTLNQEACFKLKNNQYIVKPGIENSFKCLKELLSKKTEETLKKTKSNVKQLSGKAANSISTTSFSLSSSSISMSQSLSSTALSSPLTTDEHRQYLLNFIRQWSIDNIENLQLNESQLNENDDFTFYFSTINDVLEANVVCKCGSKINLGKNAEKFQLSNYYKHLKDTKCSNMKLLKKKVGQTQSRQQATTTSTPTSYDVTDGLTPTSYEVTDGPTPSPPSSIANKKRSNEFQDSQKKTKKKKE
jgi:hypothetical protein